MENQLTVQILDKRMGSDIITKTYTIEGTLAELQKQAALIRKAHRYTKFELKIKGLFDEWILAPKGLCRKVYQ